MIRSLMVLLWFMIAATGCRKGNKNCLTENFKYHFKSNAKVDTIRVPPSSPGGFLAAVKTSGMMLVFSYSDIYTACPEMIDGGSSQTVLFEVDPAASSFTFDGEDLQAAKCYYQYGNVLYLRMLIHQQEVLREQK